MFSHLFMSVMTPPSPVLSFPTRRSEDQPLGRRCMRGKLLPPRCNGVEQSLRKPSGVRHVCNCIRKCVGAGNMVGGELGCGWRLGGGASRKMGRVAVSLADIDERCGRCGRARAQPATHFSLKLQCRACRRCGGRDKRPHLAPKKAIAHEVDARRKKAVVVGGGGVGGALTAANPSGTTRAEA